MDSRFRDTWSPSIRYEPGRKGVTTVTDEQYLRMRVLRYRGFTFVQNDRDSREYAELTLRIRSVKCDWQVGGLLRRTQSITTTIHKESH